MASRAAKSPTHLFVSPSGRTLPRWEEAFPRLRCLKAGAPLAIVEVSALVWLRLDPALPALAQVERLLAERPGVQLIVLADQPDDEQALPLFSAGIRAYINAHSTAANLKQVAQVVAAGGLWLGPGLIARLVAATSRALAATPASAPDPRLAVLTQRELEVARQIAGGASNKEVARALDIAERTVKAHAGAIFEKLGARDRLHLALIMNGRDPKAETLPGAGGAGNGGKGGTGRKPVKRAAGAQRDSAGDDDARNIAVVGLKAYPANQ